jgi:PAS domain S-box-containing protein
MIEQIAFKLDQDLGGHRKYTLLQREFEYEQPTINSSYAFNTTLYQSFKLFTDRFSSILENPSKYLLYYPANDPFMFTYRNAHEEYVNSYNYCQAFQTDILGKDKYQFGIIGGLIAFCIAWNVVMAMIYIPSLIALLRSRNNILNVLLTIPKDIAGNTYQQLKKRKSESERAQPPAVISAKGIFLAIFAAIIFFEIVCLTLTAYNSYLTMTCDFGSAEVIDNYALFVTRIRENHLILSEIVYPVAGLSNILTDGVDPVSFVDERNVLLKEQWEGILFGSGTRSGVGVYGYNPAIDYLINDLNCANVTFLSNFDGCGINHLVQQFVERTELLARSYQSMSTIDIVNQVNETFFITESLNDKMNQIAYNYSSLTQNGCTMPFPSVLIYILSAVAIAILAIPLFMYINIYLNVNHEIRNMLHFLPSDVTDQIPDLKRYVFEFHTNIKTNKDVASEGNAILEASNDAVMICNESGKIMELNSVAQNMFGYTLTDVVGKEFTIIASKQHKEELQKASVDLVKLRRGITKELEGVRKNQIVFPARFSIGIGTLNKRTVIAIFITDLTIEKKGQELLAHEKKNNEKLLLTILPAPIAARLKKGETCIAEQLPDVTCFFSDMVGFTKMSSTMSAYDLVQLLNSIVNRFDDLCAEHHLEKIKTIGDAYFCVGGLHSSGSANDHPADVVRFGLAVQHAVYRVTNGSISIRVGAHTGPIVAGVIGKSKFAYDCWGDTVNMASRMESTGLPGRVQISRETYSRVHDIFKFEERQDIEVKGKGKVTTYLVVDDTPLDEELSQLSEGEARRKNTLIVMPTMTALAEPPSPLFMGEMSPTINIETASTPSVGEENVRLLQ